jgi:hypothetical protein
MPVLPISSEASGHLDAIIPAQWWKHCYGARHGLKIVPLDVSKPSRQNSSDFSGPAVEKSYPTLFNTSA